MKAIFFAGLLAAIPALAQDKSATDTANDKVDSISAGRATAQDLHARFVSVPRAGHLSMFTAPQRLNGAIVRMFGPVGG